MTDADTTNEASNGQKTTAYRAVCETCDSETEPMGEYDARQMVLGHTELTGHTAAVEEVDQ
jgi:hypothetical protein